MNTIFKTSSITSSQVASGSQILLAQTQIYVSPGLVDYH